ncbi:hypothetical protein HDE77_002026 [Rhodanobacter sp. MP7CTX1]|nr:hypothetical protein [Rhodanobacter sp. MP7CTX1]
MPGFFRTELHSRGETEADGDPTMPNVTQKERSPRTQTLRTIGKPSATRIRTTSAR